MANADRLRSAFCCPRHANGVCVTDRGRQECCTTVTGGLCWRCWQS